MRDLIPDFNFEIKAKNPVPVYDGKEFFKKLDEKFKKLNEKNREFLFITHQFRVGFFEKKFKDLKDDRITIITRKNLDGIEGKKYLKEEFPNAEIIETKRPIHGKVFCGFDRDNIVITCGSSNLTHSANAEGKYAKKETNMIIISPIEIMMSLHDNSAYLRYLFKINGINPTNTFTDSEKLEELCISLWEMFQNNRIKSPRDLKRTMKKVFHNINGLNLVKDLKMMTKINRIRKLSKKSFFDTINKAQNLLNDESDGQSIEIRTLKEITPRKDIDIINRAIICDQIRECTSHIIKEVKKENSQLKVPDLFQ